MKANYNRKPKNVKERAVAFRAKDTDGAVLGFSILQSTLYDRLPDDKGTTYLDFENEEQIDKLINTLQYIKNRAYKKEVENDDNDKTEPR